ncbi:hypothetical protein CH75_12555 [Dyella jiangningensis]|nr:hypothetical protein CH75_12555 [Dyella jiangningensis]
MQALGPKARIRAAMTNEGRRKLKADFRATRMRRGFLWVRRTATVLDTVNAAAADRLTGWGHFY